MKTKVKRLSKRTLAMLLGILILTTCLVVGNIANVNATSLTGASYVGIQFQQGSSGNINGSSSDNYWLNFTHESSNSNHWYADAYFKTSSSGWNYYMKWVFKWSGSNEYYSQNCTYSTSNNNNVNTYGLKKDGNSDTLQAGSYSNGAVHIYFDIYGWNTNNSDVDVKVYRTSVSDLSGSLSATNSPIPSGGSTTITPSISGGSGDYSHSYTTTGGTMSGNTFNAPEVDTETTYTITDTVTDNKCPTLTKTVSTTVTVTPPNVIYVKNTVGWNNVCVYTYNTNAVEKTWPGTQIISNGSAATPGVTTVSVEKVNDIYVVTGLKDANSIIFNNATEGGNSSQQTVDGTAFKNGTLYEITNTQSGSKYTVNTEDDYSLSAYYVASGGSSLSGNSWVVADSNGKMSLSSGTTYTKTFSKVSAGTYQFRITNGTNYITDSSLSSYTGNVEPTLDGNNVKFTLGATDTSYNVTITYDSDTGAVTVNAKELSEEEEEEAAGWLYTKDNTSVEPELTGSAGNFKFIYGTSDTGLNTAIDTYKSGNVYWADLTSALDGKTSGNFFLGLSTDGTINKVTGSSSNDKINDVHYASGSSVTIQNSKGENVFTIEAKTNSSVGGNSAEYVLLRGFDTSKFSKIGVQCTCTNTNAAPWSSAVEYRFYYQPKGSSSTKYATLDIIAKDGTLRSDNGGFADTATTSIVTASNGDTAYTNGATDGVYDTNGYLFTMGGTTTVATGREYKSATLKIKKDEDVKYTLHIKTAISSTDDYNTRYFVKGWCVNGKTYGYRDSDTVTANGNYYCDIDVTYADFAATSGELYENGKIEITPIYYTVEQSKCISFRVENFNEEVQNADWGKTLYAYPFYGDLSNVKNSYGAYPGQPLVYYNGKYSIQVPIESIAIKTSDNGDDGINIRGITINNGWEDSVHRTACGWADNDRTKHKQTYDFDDFYKIYNEKNANDIIFRFKYRDTDKNYNKDNYFNANSYTGKPTLAADVTASAETANDKGWELLRDRAGRVIDIFGNPIKNTSTNEYITTTTATAADPSDLRTQSGVEPVRVVSNGYFDNCSGEYSTEWMVYSRGTSDSGDYSLIKNDSDSTKFSIVPSALLMNSADNMDNYKTYRNKPTNYYKDIYNTLNSTSAAKGKPAFIAYEKDMVRSDNAVRCDGRWYYTTSNDYVKSRIKIQYKTAAGNWVDDTYADSTNDSDITGVTTGGKAYFTNEAYENKRVSDSEIYSSDSSDNYKFTAKSGTNYQFAGWYFEYDEDTDNPTYKQITTDASGEAARTSSDLLVARYVPVKSGEVYISHEVGTDDANYPGTGTTEAKVEVLNGSNSVVKTYDYSTENIKVGNTYIKETNTGYKLKITLKTTPGTDNTFKKFAAETTTATYSKNSTALTNAYDFTTTYESSSAYTGAAIYVSVSDIINNDISTLQYYSYLIKKTHKYQIKYQFDSTRLQKEDMFFQKNGTFSETAYANNVTINGNTRTVSTAFIKSVAPHESNFKEILSIDDTCTINQSFTSDSTTVTHNITVKFKTNENKDVTGVFHLPYKYTKGSSSNGAYAAQDGYDNYKDVSEYYVAGDESGYGNSGTPIPTVSEGIMLDGSTESFNIYTTYGGHFTTAETKIYNTLDAIKNDKTNIISAPETIVKSVTKEVTKKTIYMDGNTKLTWSALGNSTSANYIAEMKRIAGIENQNYDSLTDNEKTALKNKYTYTLNGTAYRCYRVETETKYVPTDETLTFAYWKIENADREEIARCYYKDFTYLAFENYHITPTYLDNEQLAEFNKDNPSTSISYMEESRNQWNNNGGSGAQNLFDSSDSKAGDYIFVDFATSFDYQDLILKDYSGVQEIGVIVQKAGSRVDGVTSSSGYKQLYKSGETENTTAVLEDIVKNATSSGKYTNSTTNKKYQKIIIDKSNLNNKNRLDYVLTVCNSYDWNGDFETGSALHKDTTYSGNAFRVYSYIKVDDKIAVSSNPAYFCTYATANR